MPWTKPWLGARQHSAVFLIAMADIRTLISKAWFSYALVLLIALAMYQALLWIHVDREHYIVLFSETVTQGQPLWRAFANRLLAPYSIELISYLGLSYVQAHQVFVLLMTLAQNFLMFSLLLNLTERDRGATWRYFLIYIALFLLVQDKESFSWDYFDLLFFTLFSWMVFSGQPWRYFLLLFPLALINRESALFMAVYLVLDGLQFSRQGWRLSLHRRSTAHLVLGGLFLVGGLLFVEWLRGLNFVTSFYAGYGLDLDHRWFGNHFQLLTNLKDLFWDNFQSLDILNSLLFSGFVLYPVWLASVTEDHAPERHLRFLMTYYSVMLGILIFGLVNESRLYLILIPMLLFYDLAVRQQKARR